MTAGAGRPPAPLSAPGRALSLGRRRAAGLAGVACLAAVMLPLPACSSKLSTGGGAFEVLAYDLLGMDRGTTYYYETLRSAHERATFDYKATEDPFLADKCVNAILKLGEASYSRLEGQVQVIVLLAEVAVEDPISLAKIEAYEALAKMALRLPVVPAAPHPERGDQFLALLKELDGLHDEQGRRRSDTPATRQRVSFVVEQIGAFDLPTYQLVKSGASWFPSRKYITQETAPDLRDVFDRAMVRRSRALILSTLEGGILEAQPFVRRSAVQGLKILAYAPALPGVVERIPLESSPVVRGEITEYLATIGGAAAAEALVGMIEDDDPSVRWKARNALTRLSGTDLGREKDAWQAWVERGVPTMASTGGSVGAPPPPPPATFPPAAGPPAPPMAPPTAPPPYVPLPSPPPAVLPPSVLPPSVMPPVDPPPAPPVELPPSVLPRVAPPPPPTPPPTPPSFGPSLPPPRHVPGTASR